MYIYTYIYILYRDMLCIYIYMRERERCVYIYTYMHDDYVYTCTKERVPETKHANWSFFIENGPTGPLSF